MPRLRLTLATFLWCLLTAAGAFADTVRVVVEGALIWNRPQGASVIVTQVGRGVRLDVIRPAGEWFEIVIPVGLSTARSGYIRASQVELASRGPLSAEARRIATLNAASQPLRAKVAFLNVNVGYRVGDADLTRSAVAFTQEYAEAGSLDANYGRGDGIQFDLLTSQAVWGSVGVGFGVSYAERVGDIAVQARVPHPFFFNAHRSTQAVVDATGGTELAVHIPIVWVPKAGTKVKVLVYGGPSAIRVTQNLVTGLELDDPYPNTTVTPRSAVVTEYQSTKAGAHGGFDVAYFMSGSLGVGIGARYAWAPVAFVGDESSTVTGHAGGGVVSAGLRVRF